MWVLPVNSVCILTMIPKHVMQVQFMTYSHPLFQDINEHYKGLSIAENMSLRTVLPMVPGTYGYHRIFFNHLPDAQLMYYKSCY